MNEKKQIIIIVGLLVMLILVWIFVLHPPKENLDKMNASEEETGLEFKIILETAEKYFKDKEGVQRFSYEEDKDPFSLERRKVLGEKEIASKFLKELTLKGILWDSKRPLAIINGEVVRKGSIIKGIEIKRIEPNYVVLEVEGEEKFLFIEGVKSIEKEKDKKLKSEGITDEKDIPVFMH
ncbi:MAG: hypothetical protein ABID32_03685 [Candidatus Omnitrophota bacterium]